MRLPTGNDPFAYRSVLYQIRSGSDPVLGSKVPGNTGNERQMGRLTFLYAFWCDAQAQDYLTMDWIGTT